ncbi:MAG: formylglycine-generating enzyme family protein [Pseudomonadota bacterium]
MRVSRTLATIQTLLVIGFLCGCSSSSAPIVADPTPTPPPTPTAGATATPTPTATPTSTVTPTPTPTPTIPSCVGGLMCNSASCCSSHEIPAGSYTMGAPNADGSYAADTKPQHTATIARFVLDDFEVTVGRFRTFVAVYTGAAPATDSGANPEIVGSGWSAGWNASLPAGAANLITALKCSGYTWTDTVGANENRPINCVTWYEAFAFCIWDQGRLPTEAEWEYGAKGGAEDRLYPWGSPIDASYACYSGCSLGDVGSYPAGIGKWNQLDLAGNLAEWTLDYYAADWYSGAGDPCSNCANLSGVNRLVRGGSSLTNTDGLRNPTRANLSPSSRTSTTGFRCARAAP